MAAEIHLDARISDGLLFVLRAIPLFCPVSLPFKWLWHHRNSAKRKEWTRSGYMDTKKKPRCQSWLGTLRLWPLHKMRCECFLLVLHLDRVGGSGDPSTRLPPTDEVCLEFLYIHRVLHLECVSRGTLDPYNHKLAGRFLFVNQQLEFNAKTKGISWCVIIISSPLMMQPNLLWLHLLSAGLRLMRKETPSWIQSSAGKTPRLNSHFSKEETSMQTVRVSQWVHAKSPPW